MGGVAQAPLAPVGPLSSRISSPPLIGSSGLSLSAACECASPGRLRIVNLNAGAAARLYELFRGSGVRCWVMGGWGVDALLEEQTREHHDLDVLVLADDLPALAALFVDHGFEIQHVWPAENRPLDVAGETWPTAFVAATEAGVELDIHVIKLDAGIATPLCDVPWPFDEHSLDGNGVIAGRQVECVSARTQLAMHQGYELPESHQRDLELLGPLVDH